MTLLKAAATLAGSITACTAGGATIGWALGTFLPDYYRYVFRGGDDPDFNPVAMGVGQGTTQGVWLGVIAGLALVLILAWHDTRKPPVARVDARADDQTP